MPHRLGWRRKESFDKGLRRGTVSRMVIAVYVHRSVATPFFAATGFGKGCILFGWPIMQDKGRLIVDETSWKGDREELLL
jgi:hypothetical protein